jgi:hypothetical protein
MGIIIPGQNEPQNIQLPGQPFLKGKDVDTIKERHDVDATHEAIQQMLAGGTPNWFKWPHEYKSFVKESFAAEKEISDNMAKQYKWDDQDDLANRQARMVNAMSTRDFVKKLNANGIKTALTDSGMAKTVGLWCVIPQQEQKLRYVCYLQVPAMYEWSVLRIDSHGIPSGEEFRGWRTVAIQLVEKEIITEAQCHQIFGVPSANKISARYYRSLWEKRHGHKFVDPLEDGKVLGQ